MMLKDILIVLGMLIVLAACAEESSPDDFKEYEGPVMEATDVELLHSDSAVVIIRLTADRQLEFESGDREFPEGIHIEFYEKKDESKNASITANQGFFNKKENKYTATGDVVVQNFKSGEKLETEELHWEPNKNEIYTDRYVEITTNGDILMGEGLTADESFTNWKILKPKGTLSITEEENK
ncbi:LPS export ABC transporter periplasmic protein LptC [Porifericola rhodea]|uniref:LPS export ABC transporter periplasmic protein LptC n=1 Tax=Porifericola rhodea TaxID=930972 RepID=UPI002666E06A|nr:LPS export ABC transporter periplasmic protein LptC [Porifericola rhodea]WKN32633.1 LPS export ABC transporter periplasmic protein LptC [Porifericola rhodea]